MRKSEKVKPEDLTQFDIIWVKTNTGSQPAVLMKKMVIPGDKSKKANGLHVFTIAPTTKNKDEIDSNKGFLVDAPSYKRAMGLNPDVNYYIGYTITKVNVPQDRDILVTRSGKIDAPGAQVSLETRFKSDAPEASKQVLDQETLRTLGGGRTNYDRFVSAGSFMQSVGNHNPNKKLPQETAAGRAVFKREEKPAPKPSAKNHKPKPSRKIKKVMGSAADEVLVPAIIEAPQETAMPVVTAPEIAQPIETPVPVLIETPKVSAPVQDTPRPEPENPIQSDEADVGYPKQEVIPRNDLRGFDVIRVSLEGSHQKFTFAVLETIVKGPELIGCDVFPVTQVLSPESLDRYTSFAIFSDGYKEQMGLPFAKNFSIDFQHEVLKLTGVDSIEKIGYVGMGNAKEIMRRELRRQTAHIEYDLENLQGLIVVSEESPKASENPTIAQLVERGELSEYTALIFTGHNIDYPVRLKDKKFNPIKNDDGKSVTIRTAWDLCDLVLKSDTKTLAKKLDGITVNSATEAAAEAQQLLKLYPQ